MAFVRKLADGVLPILKKNGNIALYYAKAELTPPKPSELGQAAAGFNNILTSFRTGRWKQLTVKEAWLNVLVATEVTCWFFIGECIGRRHYIGYYIP